MSGDNIREGDRKKGRKRRYRGADVKNGTIQTREKREKGGRRVNEIAIVSHVCVNLF